MAKIKEVIETIGMKKICLFAHYGLAIFTALTFFILSVVATFLPGMYDVSALFEITKLIFIYVGVVVAYITIKCIFNDLQTMNRPKTKFDFIAFFIGWSMFVTLAFAITCIVYMFQKQLTDVELQMWKIIIATSGGITLGEIGGGYVYNIFKKKFGITESKDEQQEIIDKQSLL